MGGTCSASLPCPAAAPGTLVVGGRRTIPLARGGCAAHWLSEEESRWPGHGTRQARGKGGGALVRAWQAAAPQARLPPNLVLRHGTASQCHPDRAHSATYLPRQRAGSRPGRSSGALPPWLTLMFGDDRLGGRVKTCGSACHATCRSRPSDPSGRSMSLPFLHTAPARTSATRWGALTARHRVCADSMSLNPSATPAARAPGPSVTRWRSLSWRGSPTTMP
jgi:hypothetical protein